MCRLHLQQWCAAESFGIYSDRELDHRPLSTLSIAGLKLLQKRDTSSSCSKSRQLISRVVVLAFLTIVFEVESRAINPFVGSCTGRVSSEYEER